MSLSSKCRKLLQNWAAIGLLPKHLAISTSIYGEDLLIDRLLRPGSDGTYVDIGANHPVDASNTYGLYLRGWSGLAIDPNPVFAESFSKLRPRDKHLTMGVSHESGTLTYYEFSADHLNTLSPERAADLVAEGRQIIRQRAVQTEPLSAIVEKHLGDRPIDVLNVDVEGMDREVLESINLEAHRPSVLIVEDYGRYISFMRGLAPTSFETFLRDSGYRPIAQTAWSCILVGEDWRKLFARTQAFAEERLQSSYMPGQFEELPWAAQSLN